jgi:uncharacterized protein involved in response to NO
MKSFDRLFALGFRPFYLLAGVFAVVSIAYWLLSFTDVVHTGGYLRGIFWHSHEMVFGFAIAVMSGFLLTAVRNWTGLPTPTGISLAALAAVWLAGRLLMTSGPPMLAATVDVVYLPLLAALIAVPIVRSRNKRNYKIIVLLLLIAFTNVVYHLASLGPLPAWLAYTTVITAIDLITILFAIVAGRVIPAFTKNAIPESAPRHENWLEFLAFVSLVLIIVTKLSSDWISVPLMVTTSILAIAAVSHTIRLALWQPQLTLGNPLLWMMPVSYAWLPFALLLRALAGHSIVGPGVWIHALTMGAISGLMLAMMMRSSLGHTGRPLVASGVDITVFLTLQLAAVVRVSAGLFAAESYVSVVVLSGAIWVLAFAVFLLRYVPMLVLPRVDGQPG